MTLHSRVFWRTSVKGVGKNRMGNIVAVIPPLTDPSPVIYTLAKNLNASSRYGGTDVRSEESYIVFCLGEKGKKPILYWPTASLLMNMDVI